MPPLNPEETKAKILDATDQLVGTLGFDATTTRDIAERSGVNKALIHYHFGSKDELLAALLEGYYDRLNRTMVGALGKSTEPEQQAADVIDAYAGFLAQNRTFCLIVQREVASGRHVDKIVERTLPVFQLGTAWLGAVAPDPPAGLEHVHTLMSVYGMVVTYFTYGHVLAELTGQDPFSPEALEARRRHIHRVVALLFRELRRSAKPKKGDQTWAPSTRKTRRKKPVS